MDLPAPVGPTIAILCPDFIEDEKLLTIILSSVYPNLTFLNSTLPITLSTLTGVEVSGISSSSFKNSNTLSAAAAVDWRVLDILASCAIGWVKERTYWINDCISPTSMVFFTAK